MRLAGHVVRIADSKRCIKSFGGEHLKDRHHLENPGVGGSIILKLILKEWDGHRMD
jgi:hypothetical protein